MSSTDAGVKEREKERKKIGRGEEGGRERGEVSRGGTQSRRYACERDGTSRGRKKMERKETGGKISMWTKWGSAARILLGTCNRILGWMGIFGILSSGSLRI